MLVFPISPQPLFDSSAVWFHCAMGLGEAGRLAGTIPGPLREAGQQGQAQPPASAAASGAQARPQGGAGSGPIALFSASPSFTPKIILSSLNLLALFFC